MIDFRPIGYVIGLLVASLGVTMLIPLLADLGAGNDHAGAFLDAMIITVLSGGLLAMASASSSTRHA